MTSTTPRIITVALLVLAVAAPVASAVPPRDEGVQTSSLAGTTSSTYQDLRGPDARPQAVPAVPRQDLRNPDNLGPRVVAPVLRVAPNPVPVPTPAVGTDDDPSPFVYIIPAIVLIALGATGFAFARTRRSTRRTPA
jgi:hypothetical protein